MNIYLDSNIFIYLFEKRSENYSEITRIYDFIESNDAIIHTSVLTYLECVNRPARVNNQNLVKLYTDLLFDKNELVKHSLTDEIISISVKKAGKYHLKSFDSIHIATAFSANCTVFITADKKIKNIENLEIIYFELET